MSYVVIVFVSSSVIINWPFLSVVMPFTNSRSDTIFCELFLDSGDGTTRNEKGLPSTSNPPIHTYN